MLFRGAPQPYSCNCARMSLLSPLGLPKISATIAVGNFFVSRSAFSRYRLIPKLTFTRLQSSSASRLYYGMAQTESEYFTFGPYKINPSEVFYSTVLSYALVNLRPLMPDVLICPRRVVKRFVDLTANETTDLWLVAKEVGDKLERHHKASSLTFAIQRDEDITIDDEVDGDLIEMEKRNHNIVASIYEEVTEAIDDCKEMQREEDMLSKKSGRLCLLISAYIRLIAYLDEDMPRKKSSKLRICLFGITGQHKSMKLRKKLQCFVRR